MSDWKITYHEWSPEQEPLREALCTLGNGYFATRGAAEEGGSSWPHYPGTYLACGYNRAKSEIAGQTIENEDLVNWPNWLALTFRPENGSWFQLNSVHIKSFYQELNLRKGILLRKVTFKDAENRETCLTSRRLVSMADPHLAAIEWELIPLNWSGKIELSTALDGTVTNDGVARYRALNCQHLHPIDTGVTDNDHIWLLTETLQSNIRMAMAARTLIIQDGEPIQLARKVKRSKDHIDQRLRFDVQKGKKIVVQKTVAIHTSKDFAIADVMTETLKKISWAPDFQILLDRHIKLWLQQWNRCDIIINGHEIAQRILRFHILHMLQVASKNSVDKDIGIPSRGWHGEAYRGHIFWDEIFVFPFLNLRIPELARELLMYRYRRLGEARNAARKCGFKGAMFPWQSGSDGREESQSVHLNPLSGEWVPDDTYLQRHVNSAIAYNIWQYYQVTEDREFLYSYGAELILEIARFWTSYATYNAEKQRYEILGVVGPDEYHTRYPEALSPGLNNNAYTNIMAMWVISCALNILELLDSERQTELVHNLNITQEELQKMDEVRCKLYIPFIYNGIIEQFEGYKDLQEFPWKEYEQKYEDIQRLDRILGAEGNSTNNYKASKQADVLMLFFLFSGNELKKIFNTAGYEFENSQIPANIDYYLERTSHGSTLSRHIHSWVLARSDRRRSWRYFQDALRSDIDDIQGGTTHEGIHLGAMAGTVDMIQRCFTGLEVRNDVLWLNPRLPDELERVKIRIRYRGHWLSLDIRHDIMIVKMEKGWSGKIKLNVNDKAIEMETGDSLEINLDQVYSEDHKK